MNEMTYSAFKGLPRRKNVTRHTFSYHNAQGEWKRKFSPFATGAFFLSSNSWRPPSSENNKNQYSSDFFVNSRVTSLLVLQGYHNCSQSGAPRGIWWVNVKYKNLDYMILGLVQWSCGAFKSSHSCMLNSF